MCEMAEQDFNKLKKLIAEVRKPNRGMLYDLKNAQYKNNKIKQIIWAEIAEEMEMTPKNVQGLWKLIKIKYNMAQAKADAPSGSARKILRPIDDFLLKEMSFINSFFDDDEPRTSNYTDKNTENIQQFFDDFAAEVESSTTVSTPPPKRKKKSETQIALESSFKRIEEVVESCKALSNPQRSSDAFYLYFEQQMESLDAETKEKLKPVILNLIAEKKFKK